jgi:hypothetical protein
MRMDPTKATKIRTIVEWQKPTAVKEVQAFLGLANFYRRFTAEFSATVKPLTQLTKKELVFDWMSAVKRPLTLSGRK